MLHCRHANSQGHGIVLTTAFPISLPSRHPGGTLRPYTAFIQTPSRFVRLMNRSACRGKRQIVSLRHYQPAVWIEDEQWRRSYPAIISLIYLLSKLSAWTACEIASFGSTGHIPKHCLNYLEDEKWSSKLYKFRKKIVAGSTF